jgi:hypothetical protein
MAIRHGLLLSRREFLAASAAAGATALVASGSRARGASPGALDSVVSAAIHPGIGVARVGDSGDAFYLGPEVPFATAPQDATLKDATGAVARQAARFRVFGYDADGQVVAELTEPDVAIDWTVHLAGRKPAWYRFDTALDIPEARPATRRNAAIVGQERAGLVADAGRRSIATATGRSVTLDAVAMGHPLVLGELMVDPDGRLVALAGRGAAFAWEGARLTTFANNDGWVDDIADGPVSATVRIGRRTLEARPAWLVTSPPNFAPGIATGWRTLHDVLEDTWAAAGMAIPAEDVRFERDVLPLFARLTDLQWANAGLLRDFGWQSLSDFTDPAVVERLGDASEANKPFRMAMAARFRDPAADTLDPRGLPPILGDAVAFPPTSPRQWIGPTDLQQRRIRSWAEGDFMRSGREPDARSGLEALPLAEQPAALDRAQLEACLGDAFHPGCEVTWPVRQASMWEAPYRLAVRTTIEPDFGDELTPDVALGHDGPLTGSFPGSISRWMAIPWMTDTSSCRSGYEPSVDPYLDTFWPARVPNQVLAEDDYRIVMDASQPLDVRVEAFLRRRDWLRSIMDGGPGLMAMLSGWPGLGMVAERPGPGDDSFPRTFRVEVLRSLAEPPDQT